MPSAFIMRGSNPQEGQDEILNCIPFFVIQLVVEFERCTNEEALGANLVWGCMKSGGDSEERTHQEIPFTALDFGDHGAVHTNLLGKFRLCHILFITNSGDIFADLALVK